MGLVATRWRDGIVLEQTHDVALVYGCIGAAISYRFRLLLHRDW
ncbi:MAG: hypothetical protein AVDCRST_MAG58-2290 [uncultured Rubrobacteraceae bacterium]|uniref:Uncharacterized protein n=1 Tax=uncultured Rubrobacteraceae bacterium TaxID=349277 RepID=A0A6J4R9K6_9ACTN|nr:MAG: hypothetical protein AVDCRST_MAG58-2290 [uncultured Rubrobacteraceae bacterium]